jgi:general stress protein CsbA
METNNEKYYLHSFFIIVIDFLSYVWLFILFF